MINRKELRESLTEENIIYLMSLLGTDQYLDQGGYIQFPSICHNIDESQAGLNLSYYKDSHRFYCFSNCGSMDIFQVIKNRWELLENGEDTHFENLAYWVMNHSQIDLDSHRPMTFNSYYDMKDYSSPTTEIVLPERSKNILDAFMPFYPVEWLNDGISEEAMDRYNILFSSTRNSIIIPHYDVNGRLIGVRRRALDPEDAKRGKYRPIYIEGISYSHPLGYNLYGLDVVKEKVKRRGKIVIAEGEKAALQSRTLYGDDNYVVAACGHRINRWQIHLIMKYTNAKEIILAFDKGIQYEHMEALAKRYSLYTRMSFVYDDYGWLEKKESPFDRPDKLEQLLKTRVKIR